MRASSASTELTAGTLHPFDTHTVRESRWRRWNKRLAQLPRFPVYFYQQERESKSQFTFCPTDYDWLVSTAWGWWKKGVRRIFVSSSRLPWSPSSSGGYIQFWMRTTLQSLLIFLQPDGKLHAGKQHLQVCEIMKQIYSSESQCSPSLPLCSLL